MNADNPRVLILPASYSPRNRTIGGGERYALEVARTLAARTPTVQALFAAEAGSEHDGPLETRTFAVRYAWRGLRLRFSPETRAALRAFDVFHLMCFPTPAAEALILFARRHGQRIVLTDVGGGGRSLSGYLQKLHRRLDLHRLAHGLAHLSAYAGRFFSDWPQPAVTLFGGVNPSLLGTAAGEPRGYALFVGRLLPHKGVLEAIQALKPGTPLRVVGRPYDTAYFGQLQQAAQGKDVTFLTDADDAELARQYAGASVVLQVSLSAENGPPDKSELLGLVALEGMAGGKPVIVTRTTSLPELVRDGETGFIVPPRDLGALGDKMELLVRDAELSRRLGAQARGHVAGNFTWPRVADRALAFYRQLAERRPR